MRTFLNRFPKWFVMGLAGLLGGLLSASFAEPWAQDGSAQIENEIEHPMPLDLVFVLDVSGSMSGEIEGVRSSLVDFLAQLKMRKINARFGLVTFDTNARVEYALSDDIPGLVETMRPLFVKGGRRGGDGALGGLMVAAGMPFRPDARKVIVFITDETFDIPDGEIFASSQVVEALRAARMDEINLVTPSSLLDDYAFLSQAAGGKSFILDAHGRRIEGLVTLFKEVAVSIADSSVLRTSGSVGSRVDVESVRRSFWRNALQAGIWTGLICIGVGVPVQFVQRGILGSQFDPFAVLRAVSVCMALGFVSGVLGQGLYAFALASSPDAGTWSRIVSWVFIGAGLGLSLSAAVPNLDVRRSILFGGFGGGIAAVGFIVLASSGSDSASRLLGAALMGLCISESVTIAEALAREAHLLIHWGQNETTCVNLGPSPVVVGTSRDSTVRLPPSSGYPAQVASFVLRGGKAILINHMTQSQHPLKDGNKLKLGAMTIEVRLFAHGRGVSPP